MIETFDDLSKVFRFDIVPAVLGDPWTFQLLPIGHCTFQNVTKSHERTERHRQSAGIHIIAARLKVLSPVAQLGPIGEGSNVAGIARFELGGGGL